MLTKLKALSITLIALSCLVTGVVSASDLGKNSGCKCQTSSSINSSHASSEEKSGNPA